MSLSVSNLTLKLGDNLILNNLSIDFKHGGISFIREQRSG